MKEKPKKMESGFTNWAVTGFLDHAFRDGQFDGRNMAIDEYEKFLPDEDEIREIIDSRLDCPNCDNSGRTMPDGEQCEFCYREENSRFNLAKAMAKRIGI